jgi:predicted nucleotidyltransferase component of viral defense system
MIPKAYITEWWTNVPWQTNEQVEQDLVICRALTAIFSDSFLAASLAFRGGTALHKLFFHPQPRYSEDIDLVQINSQPIKETITRLQERLSFLGDTIVLQKNSNNTLKFRFPSEFSPDKMLRLKIEINCREHFSVLGYHKFPFEVNSAWFAGRCDITTYKIEELLGTKLRALYQRRKGRDLFDLYTAISLKTDLNIDNIVLAYKKYMEFSVLQPPTQKLFLKNMELKMSDKDFLGDTLALLRIDEKYNHNVAYELVKDTIISKI